MESWDSLSQLLVLLGTAAVLGTLAERLRQSAMVGYLIAGIVVGPHALGWVRHQGFVETLAELGVALLLFGVGLEFSISRLLSMGRVALVGGTLQILLTTGVVAAIAWRLGLSPAGAVAGGLIVAMSSTACVMRLLTDRRALDSPWGRSATGLLILQDAAVLPATLLVQALARGGGAGHVAMGIVKTVGIGLAAVAVFYVLFSRLLPRLLHLQRWTGNRELPVLLAAVIGLGSALLAHEAGISPAIGAFVAGVLLAGSVYSVQIRADVLPLKTLMLTLFFTSTGMLLDAGWVLGNPLAVIGATLALLALKAVLTLGVLWAIGVSLPVAVATSLAVAEIGEFGFVLAQIASRGTLLSEYAFHLLVSASVLTLIASPALVSAASRVSSWMGPRGTPEPLVPFDSLASSLAATPGDPAGPAGGLRPARPILIIGFGPAGQGVAEGLIAVCPERLRVIDLSTRSEKRARDYGLQFHLGDARQQEVLEAVGVGEASILAITLPDPESARQIVHLCRHLQPGARIFVRSRYHVSVNEMVVAGADVVVDEEYEMGQRLARHILDAVGEEPVPGEGPRLARDVGTSGQLDPPSATTSPPANDVAAARAAS